jgi:hypothetical protein
MNFRRRIRHLLRWIRGAYPGPGCVGTGYVDTGYVEDTDPDRRSCKNNGRDRGIAPHGEQIDLAQQILNVC